ncbi:dioxygenase [Leptolyngbya sp. Heron Island J]|uniref:dioxygenase family protein n=1 Tax=Leptolyngbya sp. Heron Island J TaxID=1385935 RepID=UPI0003B99FB0|nr:dioxygenase [Leptolyngbya sp. Heron Island J]ESA32734.1 dioxygenase [Leptolyngbya sp. Heron Island J]
MPRQRLNRRTLLQLGPVTLVSFLSATCSRSLNNTTRQTAQATPACGDDLMTPSQTAGPFYTPDSPERQSLLEPGFSGTAMVLAGQVLSSQCVPIAGALVDCWHTDDQGNYDNSGYRFRGHQFTDADGRYQIETIVPGIYPGRTRHFHIKVQAPNQPVLTTQLYFPEEPANQRDFLFNPVLLMAVDNSNDLKQATFNFVLETA